MTITLTTLDRYVRFHGDSDKWSLTPEGRANPSGADEWRLIDELLMKLQASANARVTPEFARELENQLSEHVPDQHVIDRLRRLLEESATW